MTKRIFFLLAAFLLVALAPFHCASGQSSNGHGGGGSGLPAGPTSPNGVAQTITSTPSAGVAGPGVYGLSGVPTRGTANSALTSCAGNVDTILATDRGGFVEWNDASACAVSLPQAGSTNFTSGMVFIGCNYGAGTVTITPVVSTITYVSGSGVPTVGNPALTQSQCITIYSDNTNYFGVMKTAGGSFPDLTDTAGQLIFPVGSGSAPSITFAGHTGIGFWWIGANSICAALGSTCSTYMGGGNYFTVAGDVFGWSSNGGDASLTHDTGFSRYSAGVIAAGNGNNADESALLRSGMPCRITSDVSLTVNTANSFCSWSLPTTKSWAWQCNIIWALTAGTGTNTFSLGVNASQTPASTTNAAATIYTTQTGTQTQGVAALSASGAVNVLTSPTYTPAATLEQALASGTIAYNASTLGTFAITATAAGTTATAAIKAGSVCTLQ